MVNYAYSDDIPSSTNATLSTSTKVSAKGDSSATIEVSTKDNVSATNSLNAIYNRQVSLAYHDIDKYLPNQIYISDFEKTHFTFSIPKIDHFNVSKDKQGNPRAVVVKFSDGTSTSSACHLEDKFDLETGIMVCIMKKVFGKNMLSKIQKVIKTQNDFEQLKEKVKAEEKEKKLREAKKLEKLRAKKLKRKVEYEARLKLMVEKRVEELKPQI